MNTPILMRFAKKAYPLAVLAVNGLTQILTTVQKNNDFLAVLAVTNSFRMKA